MSSDFAATPQHPSGRHADDENGLPQGPMNLRQRLMGRGYAYGDDADAMDREVGRLAVKPNGHKPTQPEMSIPKPGLGPRPVGGRQKLGTFAGVFVPTSLNVLSILMFLRFGFILGQGGVVGMIGMLVAAYLIDLVTTFSLSAIATNGTVRGGGAY
jgi:hypothetical protein